MLEQLLLQTVLFSKMAFKVPVVVAKPTAPSLEQSASPLQRKKSDLVAPYLEAKSALAYDITSGTLLFEKNIEARRRMASIAKLMTAIIILENHRLDEKVTITKPMTRVEPVKAGLLPGEEITVENLLYALLIHSANDAALALAIHDSISEEKFVATMNDRAKRLGLKNTNFSNATGLDTAENFSTASDILRLAIASLEYDFIRKAVRIPMMEIRSADGRIRHRLENTNELIKTNGKNGYHIYGLKTGNTIGAGPSLIALSDGPNGNGKKREILTIVLGSKDRFQESKILIDWVFRAYEFR